MKDSNYTHCTFVGENDFLTYLSLLGRYASDKPGWKYRELLLFLLNEFIISHLDLRKLLCKSIFKTTSQRIRKRNSIYVKKSIHVLEKFPPQSYW